MEGNRDGITNVDLRYMRRTIIHRMERMIYLKKTRNNVIGLLLLTQDSFEMLQIRNGESGQKGGRKGKGDRIREMGCGRFTGRTMEIRRRHVNVMNTNTCRSNQR